MSYEDIATRSRLSQNIRSNLAGIGQGYADTAFAKYRMAMDQRRMDREDELYQQKQRVERQERRKERAGARLTAILASGIPTEQMYKQIQALQKEFENTDLAGTDAGRGMFGAYGMFGRRGTATVDPRMQSIKDINAIVTAREKFTDDEGVVDPHVRSYFNTLIEEKIGEAGFAKHKEGHVRMRKPSRPGRDGKGIIEGAIFQIPEKKAEEYLKKGWTLEPRLESTLKGGMSDLVAASEAAGRKIRKAAVIEPATPAKGWTDEQYGDELMSMYGDILGGPGDRQPTPEELRAENTKEAYEKGKKLGYWK